MYHCDKIFIVDDDSIVLSTLKMLMELEGFHNVDYFDDPLKALLSLKTSKPCLILSDFMMPQMNGIEFLSKAKLLCPEISMILLTGYADKENAIKAINDVGIYKYIEKPWDNADLIMNIKNGLERSNLILQLNSKINELSLAKKELEKYNHSLEDLVRQKTACLLESNSKLNAIINFCADGIVLLSTDGHIIQSNPAFHNITGLGDNYIINKPLKDFFTSDSKLFDNVFLEKEILVNDIEIKNSINDKIIPVEINFSPVFSDENTLIYYVGVVRNVAAQKELDRLRDDFIATLTHDLRTPLLAAIQTLQFFLDGSLGALDKRQSTLLDTMKKSNEDMLGLVNALLEVYKYESGKLALCCTEFDLKEFINDCLSQLVPLAQKKNISINFNQIAEVSIFADKKELRRVVMNLCGNALNHTPDGGNVKISAHINNENAIVISVQDNGSGIPRDDIPKLFKRFSQGTSKKRSVGTGLGLYLSRQIVEAHGGKIWAESELNNGSTFSVLLPDSIVKNIHSQH